MVQLSDFYAFASECNIGIRAVGGCLEFKLHDDSVRSITEPSIIENWEVRSSKDPRQLVGFRVYDSLPGVSSVRISPAFVHDSKSDSKTINEYETMWDAIKAVAEILLRNLTCVNESSKQLKTTQDNKESIHKDDSNTLFRLLRANRYKVVRSDVHDFMIVPGMCENLSDLEIMLNDPKYWGITHWSLVEGMSTLEGNKWVNVIKPSRNVVLHTPGTTFTSLVETLIAGIQRSVANKDFLRGIITQQDKVEERTFTETQVRTLLAMVRSDLNGVEANTIVDKLLSAI